MQKEDTIYSISLLNNLINKKITSHDEFRNVKIQGETDVMLQDTSIFH